MCKKFQFHPGAKMSAKNCCCFFFWKRKPHNFRNSSYNRCSTNLSFGEWLLVSCRCAVRFKNFHFHTGGCMRCGQKRWFKKPKQNNKNPWFQNSSCILRYSQIIFWKVNNRFHNFYNYLGANWGLKRCYSIGKPGSKNSSYILYSSKIIFWG